MVFPVSNSIDQNILSPDLIYEKPFFKAHGKLYINRSIVPPYLMQHATSFKEQDVEYPRNPFVLPAHRDITIKNCVVAWPYLTDSPPVIKNANTLYTVLKIAKFLCCDEVIMEKLRVLGNSYKQEIETQISEALSNGYTRVRNSPLGRMLSLSICLKGLHISQAVLDSLSETCPRIHQLSLIDSPITKIPQSWQHTLQRIEVRNCPQFKHFLGSYSQLTTIIIENCPEFSHPPSYLPALSYIRVRKCQSILWLHDRFEPGLRIDTDAGPPPSCVIS